MGSFVFKWDHPASEVYVTGTFDDWSKSEKLIKTGDTFEKNVTLPSATEKIYYKFVVDGNWVTDHTAPQENDHSGNLNNVLTIDRIIKHTPETAGIMSGVTPTSTTAELAKEVPLEKAVSGSSDLPGSFPETPGLVETGDFSVNPLPAADGAVNPIKLAPGEKVPDPSTFTNHTVTSNVQDDPELVAAAEKEGEQVFGVSPLPAFPGAINPIKLAPGEKVPDPSTFTNSTVTSNVHDDPELVAAAKEEGEQTFSVNPLPSFPGAINPVKLAPGEKVPDPSTLTNSTVTSNVHDDPELVAAAKKEGEQTFSVDPLPAFPGGVNPISLAPGEKIPAVSHITGNTVNSGVTLDKESYENSGALGNVPVLPPVVTPQNERDQNGTGILDLPPISKNMIPESSLPMGTAGDDTFDASPMVQSSGPMSTTAQLAAAVPLESTKVPEVVKESQKEAGVEPEASAIPEEVGEKSAVEKELLKEIPVAPSTSEGTAGKGTEKSENGITAGETVAAVGGAALAIGGAAFAFASGAASDLTKQLPTSVQESIASINAESVNKIIAKDTPEIVKESIVASGQGAEAAGNEEAVLEKKAMEKELLAEIKPETSTGEPAPKIIAETPAPKATVPETPSGLVAPVVETPIDSREVSPGTVPGSHPPTTPAKVVAASTPSTSTKVAESPAASTTTDKKKKRTSFFGKLKEKLSHKH